MKQGSGDSLLGLVMVASVIIGLFSFARISLIVTMILSGTLVAGLLVFFWVMGRRKRKSQSSQP